jgi:hypothetical protein
MASEGPRSPGTMANDAAVGAVAWTNTGNAVSSNDSYATCVFGGGSTTQYLKATNFGFAIPSGATIDGIAVAIERKDNFNRARDERVRLVKGGVVQSTDKAVGSLYPTTDAVANYGGAADTWGGGWTDSDINSSGFGLVLQCLNTNVKDSASVAVDHITITVHYTEGGGGPINADVVPGAVGFIGVTPGARKPAVVAIASLTITGVAVTVQKRPAVSTGGVTFAGVSPLGPVNFAVAVGSLAMAGVTPAPTRPAAVTAGTVTFGGITPQPPIEAAANVGTLAIGAGPRNDVQQFSFNGATMGSVQASTTTPGISWVLFLVETEATWHSAFALYATITPTGDGFTATFDKPITTNRAIDLFSIDFSASGLVTTSRVQYGRGYPVTVQKRPAVSTGGVTFAGVSPGTGPRSFAVAVGTLTLIGSGANTARPFAVAVGMLSHVGVALTSQHPAAASTGSITLTGVAVQGPAFGHAATGVVNLAGVAPASRKPQSIAVGTFTVVGVAAAAQHVHAMPVGEVDLSGVAVGTRKQQPLPIGTVSITGETPTQRDRASVAVGQLELAGVAPATIKRFVGPVGQLQFIGIAASSSQIHTMAIGAITLTGVSPAWTMTTAVAVGTFTLAGVIPSVELQVISGPFIAVAWTNWQPGDKEGVNWQPGDSSGTSFQPGVTAGTN